MISGLSQRLVAFLAALLILASLQAILVIRSADKVFDYDNIDVTPKQLFLQFDGLVEEHNTTIDGAFLPGPFYQDQLYLLGARLTTSYEQDNDIVEVTLFGMPGDFWRRKKDHKIRCNVNTLNAVNGTMFNHSKSERDVALYAKVMPEGSIIPMEFVPTLTGDVNNNGVTLIWKADLRPFITRTDIELALEKQEYDNVFHQTEKAVRIEFSIEVNDEERRNDDKSLSHLATVDIPLSTGVVGHAGPQVRTTFFNSTYRRNKIPSFLVPSFSTNASLCVAMYGEETAVHLPEFVQHHLNVGFDQIIVGVLRTHLGSDMIHHVQNTLAPFLEHGSVVLAAMGLGSDLECEINIEKTHFYNGCLYHSKGVAKYMGNWDVDEHWLPPLSEDEWRHHTDALSERGETKQTNRSVNMAPEQGIIWQQSSYSKIPDIYTVMESIQAYQELHSCGEEWCYHSFPSVTVFRRRIGEGATLEDTNRTFTIQGDFDRREDKLNLGWAKAVVRTKFTNAGATHMAGSCRWPLHDPDKYVRARDVTWSSSPYHDSRYLEPCRNLRIEGFGLMHHFSSLNRIRSRERRSYKPDLPVDEYVHQFAETVQKQLSVLNKQKDIK